MCDPTLSLVLWILFAVMLAERIAFRIRDNRRRKAMTRELLALTETMTHEQLRDVLRKYKGRF